MFPVNNSSRDRETRKDFVTSPGALVVSFSSGVAILVPGGGSKEEINCARHEDEERKGGDLSRQI